MSDDPNIADSRKSLRFFLIALAAMSGICAVSWVVMIHQTITAPDYGGAAADLDFSVFWAAARLAVEGRWTDAFDPLLLDAARHMPPGHPGADMLWFYPPGFHILLWPLGYLPFVGAWLVFAAISVATLLTAINMVARGVPGAAILVLCAPVTLLTLAIGQNPLLTAALLALGLAASRGNNAPLAGLAFALMTLKPQLGLAIPVALIAAGHWRTIGWGAFFAAILVAGTLVFPGVAYWTAFFEGLASGSARLRDGSLEPWMISAFGTFRMLGFGEQSALIAQAVVTFGTAMALAWLWRRPTNSDLKAAGLCLATLLMTPYALYYELVIALIAALFLWRAGMGDSMYGRGLLIVLWVTPVVAIPTTGVLGFAFAMPLLVLLFAFTIKRTWAVA